ncbi:MAG: DUF2218 domain-containing protein [Thalassovita sp.]
MSQTASATAATQSASRYLQQLCKHWGHKAAVEFTPESGDIRFESGNVLTLQAMPDQLDMQVSVPDDGDLAHFKDVVDRHIQRFAFREDLQIIWA